MIFSRFKDKLKSVFTKTRSLFGERLRSLFSGRVDEETLEDLRILFYEADLGPKVADDLVEKVKLRAGKNMSAEELLEGTKQDLLELLSNDTDSGITNNPHVILVVGANGSGKTTSIAKLANYYKSQNKKVLLAAADTFRAAAVEQLERWANSAGVDIVKGKAQGDPAAVTYDAVAAAKARGVDVVIIDTAGRLQNRHDLMQELEKIKRCCHKQIENSPHETLLVLDANTGQNGIDQAKVFHDFTPLTGLILTKLDGSAKGGVIVGVQQQVGISVKYIGVGEGMEDFEPFVAKSFVDALFS